MKRVIITGVTGGLGSELSNIFIDKGVEVIGISRSKPMKGVIHIRADLSKESDVEKAVGVINDKYPEFDCLINSAGVLSVQELENLDFKEIDNLFKVNVLAPMKLVSGLIENIKSNEADIVNVGSSVGFKAYERQCAYGASKWAVRGMNENMQLELKKTKCRIIGFNPGGFKSDLFEKATGKKADLDDYMEPKDLAEFMIQILELPKKLEVSEVIINRK